MPKPVVRFFSNENHVAERTAEEVLSVLAHGE